MLTPHIENPPAIVRTVESHDQTTATKAKRKRKRSHGNKPSGAVTACESVASSRLISLFLRSLSAKEKGYALGLLLKLARDQQEKPAAPAAE